MITFPKAKINIGLRVLRRKSDGYHDIQSLMYPIPLYDVLEVIPSPDGMIYDFGRLDFEGTPEDNLVVKAYKALKALYPSALPPIQIILRKMIPTGAGMGGGSSDATAMLLLLNRMFELGAFEDTLHRLAVSLGADCPFFLKDTPQIAEGIGDILTPYHLDLSGKYLTLLTSAIQINTGEAYAGICPNSKGLELMEYLKLPISEWRGKVVNHFEASIFPKYPELQDGIQKLYTAGALYASMSGSGPTLYGISETPIEIAEWQGKVYSLQL